MKKTALFLSAVAMLWPVWAQAQQKLGYIDSEFILENVPEYATVQQKIDRMGQEWQREMEKMEEEIEEAFREYQARELLYTNEERQTRRDEIMTKEQELEQFRLRHFGPEGELFNEQERLMRPIQENILEAIEEVATTGGYDYVFDKNGDFLFVFFREQYDLSLDVLDEMGIDTENLRNRTGGRQ